MVTAADSYPARLEVDYPEKLDRFTTFFRVVWVIPIMIVLVVLSASVNETIVSEELESPFEVTHMGTELEITLIYPFQTAGEPFIAVKQ